MRCVQAADEASDLHARISRAEAKWKVAQGEASEGQSALATLQADLGRLYTAIAQAFKACPCPALQLVRRVQAWSGACHHVTP